MGPQGSPHPSAPGLRLQWTQASCFQTQRTRTVGHQDVLLLQRQVTALRGHLAELRAATERCVPATLPTQSQAWAPSGSGRRAPDAQASGPPHSSHGWPEGSGGDSSRGGQWRRWTVDRVRQARVQGREERQAREMQRQGPDPPAGTLASPPRPRPLPRTSNGPPWAPEAQRAEVLLKVDSLSWPAWPIPCSPLPLRDTTRRGLP